MEAHAPQRTAQAAAQIAAEGTRPLRRSGLIAVAVFFFGLGLQADRISDLGLWNDDVVQYLQPHHAAGGDALRFVLVDSTRFLRAGERPLAYVPFAFGRVAYLAGVPWLTLFAVGLACLAAALFARFARHLTDEPVGILMTGAFAVLWPISPLVLFWPSAVHYSFAACLAVLAAEAALAPGGRRWILAGALHLAACLTLEIEVVAAPSLVLAAWVSSDLGGRPKASWERAARLRAVASLVVASGLLVLWRLVCLPRLGTARIDYESQALHPAQVLEKLPAALQAVTWPWRAAVRAASNLEPRGADLLSAMTPLAWTAIGALILGVWLADRASPRSPSPVRWGSSVREALAGVVLVLPWLVVLPIIPGAFEKPTTLGSRLSYPIVFGAAALASGVLLTARRWVVGRARRLATVGTLALVAAVAVCGGGFLTRVLRAHVDDWNETSRILERVAELCPSIAPESFVVLDTDWPTTLLGHHSGMSHQVVSSLLIARYDDPSLRGSRRAALALRGKRLIVEQFGERALWFEAGDYGVINANGRATERSVDRGALLLFVPDENDRLELGATTRIASGRRGGGEVVGHPERCLATPVPPSPALCHALPDLCREAVENPLGAP